MVQMSLIHCLKDYMYFNCFLHVCNDWDHVLPPKLHHEITCMVYPIPHEVQTSQHTLSHFDHSKNIVSLQLPTNLIDWRVNPSKSMKFLIIIMWFYFNLKILLLFLKKPTICINETLWMDLVWSRAQCILTIDPPKPIQGPQWSNVTRWECRQDPLGLW